METFEYVWKVDVIPKKEEDSKLEAMSYVDMLSRVQLLFPMQNILNKDSILRDVGSQLDRDPEKVFLMGDSGQPQLPQGQTGNAQIQNPLSSVNRNNLEVKA
jgi:hypothetical protein